VPNLENRTRPDLVERILAQRARRAEITVNNQELPPLNDIQQLPPPAVQQTLNAEATTSQQGNMDEEEVDSEEEGDRARRRGSKVTQQQCLRSSSPPPHLPAKRQVGFVFYILILILMLYMRWTRRTLSHRRRGREWQKQARLRGSAQ
jgi:hypothetical protein